IRLLVGWMVTPAGMALRTGANLSVRTLALGCVMAGPRWSVNPGHISCCALPCNKPYRDVRFIRYGRGASGATLRPAPEAGMHNLRSSHAFLRFGTFDLDRHTGELRRDGARIRMQEQPLQILRILLERPGEIITREELQQRVWPSHTFVDFDHGINNAIKRLREALGDTADTPRYVETIPRRGYRFIGRIEREAARFRSLAVLPLENLSRAPEQEYFAEGLTEALITVLAKIGGLRVVSRTSAMIYQGARKPLREIARELEVDTIVEGTVLRVGDRVRITAQLI